MRFGVVWLTACLVTVTCSQSLTIEHFITNHSEAPNNHSTERSVNRNDTSNNDNYKTLHNMSQANSPTSYRDLSYAAQTDDTRTHANVADDQTNESSTSKEPGTHKSTSVEDSNPSIESKSTENTSDTNSRKEVDSKESNGKVLSEDFNARVSEEDSGANLSPDSSGDSQNPPIESGEPETGPEPDAENTSDDDEGIELLTTHGPVKGHKWKDTDIYAFIDIPYGKVENPFEVSARTFGTTNKTGPSFFTGCYEN